MGILARVFLRVMIYLLMVFLVLEDAVVQALQVIGGNVTVVQGDGAVLPCLLTNSTESLTQITWQKRTRLIKQNTNFYTILSSNGPLYTNGYDERFSFVGNVSVNNGSLRLSNVTLTDEGIYTCIYTLFPSGNYKTEIPLNVIVPPTPSMKNNPVFVGKDEVIFGSCIAAHSWPPAKIVWHVGNLSDRLRITQNSSENADGTITTIHTLSGKPTRDIHNYSAQCEITSPASPGGTLLPLIIQIKFPPSEVIITQISKNSFECTSSANPVASVTWERRGQPLPPGVKVSGAVLHIPSPTAEVNALYVCIAHNTYGASEGPLYLHFSSEGASAAGWVMFGLLLIACTAAAALWFHRSDKKCALPWITRQENPRPTERDLEGMRSQRQSLTEREPESETEMS